jgi:hypothetical protein
MQGKEKIMNYATHEDWILDMLPPPPFGEAEQQALQDAVMLTCAQCGEPFQITPDDPMNIFCPACRKEEQPQ